MYSIYFMVKYHGEVTSIYFQLYKITVFPKAIITFVLVIYNKLSETTLAFTGLSD